MSKKVQAGILILILLAVAGAGVLWSQRYFASQEYSVVYLRTGEVYVGKLSRFPKPVLKDAYILTVTKPATPAAASAAAVSAPATTPAPSPAPAPEAGDKNQKKPAPGPSFQLLPLKETVWAATSIELKMDQVMFTGRLDESSKAAQALKTAKK